MVYVPQRILFAEDDLLCDAAIPYGFERLFTIVRTGTEALQRLLDSTSTFDAFRLDNKMPEKTGLQVLAELRTLHADVLDKLKWILFKSSDVDDAMRSELHAIRTAHPHIEAHAVSDTCEGSLWEALIEEERDPSAFYDD